MRNRFNILAMRTLVAGATALIQPQNVEASNLTCTGDHGRAAQAESTWFYHSVRLLKDGQEVLFSYGKINGFQADNIATEFCKNGALPMEVQYAPLSSETFCRTPDGRREAQYVPDDLYAMGFGAGRTTLTLDGQVARTMYPSMPAAALSFCKTGSVIGGHVPVPMSRPPIDKTGPA